MLRDAVGRPDPLLAVNGSESAEGVRVRAEDRAHVFHSWSAQAEIDPMPVAGGSGARFWDYEGTTYLDFASQRVSLNLGHQHPVLVDAVRRQAERLCTVGPAFANDPRGQLAREISRRAPAGLDQVFFTSGGAEANEHAMRMARVHTGRHKVVSFYRSYHGSTAGAIAASGDPRRWPTEPGVPGIVHAIGPYLYRTAFESETHEQEGRRALRHLREVISLEGPASVAAVMIEPVVGTNGVLVPPEGYLAGVRGLCDEFGIMLICDEVLTGFGRIGEWFAADRWQVTPDLITFAKGVNSGYVPLGGVVISREVAASFAHRPYPGGLTYSGHPLACAVGLASLEVLEREGLLDRTRDLGERIVGPALADMAARHPSVGEVRGLGLLWAVELVRSRTTREPLVPHHAPGRADDPMAQLMTACRAQGVWPFPYANRLNIAPPLVITEEELHRGLDAVDQALVSADEWAD